MQPTNVSHPNWWRQKAAHIEPGSPKGFCPAKGSFPFLLSPSPCSLGGGASRRCCKLGLFKYIMNVNFNVSFGLRPPECNHTWGEETQFYSSLFANECVRETGGGEGGGQY